MVDFSDDSIDLEIILTKEAINVRVREEDNIVELSLDEEVFNVNKKEDIITIFPSPTPYALSGPKGDTGIGTKGDTGTAGAKGEQGIGAQGDTGLRGPGGGDKGDTGAAGLDGQDGAQGDTGISGTTYYTNLTPVPVPLGGVTAGETFNSTPITTMFDKLLYPYQSPAFGSFSFPQSPNPLEVGQSIAGGNKTFTWSTSNSSNVSPNTIAIADTTASVVLASSLANTGSTVISISAITKVTNTSHAWQISGTNTNLVGFNKSFSIPWYWAVWYGEDATTPLTASGIKALRVKTLSSSSAGSYSFIAVASKYKYICYPTVLGLKTTFKDPSTNLDVAMFSPYSVSVTNDYGVTTNYYVHRTLNKLGGAITIVVS